MTASAGVRYGHVGFLKDSHYLDPSAALAFEPDEHTRIQGGLTTHTLTPGGDLLTLSTLAATPAIGYALLDDDLRAEKVVRYDLSFEKALDEGQATIGTHLFYEDVRNRLVNAFGRQGSARSLRVLNGPGMSARGLGLTLGRRFGSAISGSVTYTYGQSWADGPQGTPAAFVAQPQGDFHDVVARVQTVIERSDTRLTVYYRINALSLDDPAEAEAMAQPLTTKTRFDVQFSQGVPFLGSLTRAEWDLLLALRNVFYEPDEGGTLDEMAVFKPPTRVLGGISVRF
jgi:outer membrane receptor protein involved in Fe transport